MFKLNSVGVIIIEDELLLIPEFHKIYTEDTSTNKSLSFKIFEYIYFMCDYKSPYNNYGEDKETQIVKDFFRDGAINLKTPDIEAAMKKYNELKKIPEVHVLEASRALMFKVADYMNKVDLNGRTFKGACDALANVSKTIASYSQVKESVEKEIGKTGRNRANRTKGNRED